MNFRSFRSVWDPRQSMNIPTSRIRWDRKRKSSIVFSAWVHLFSSYSSSFLWQLIRYWLRFFLFSSANQTNQIHSSTCGMIFQFEKLTLTLISLFTESPKQRRKVWFFRFRFVFVLPNKISTMCTKSWRFEKSRNEFVISNCKNIFLSDSSLTSDGLFFLDEFRCRFDAGRWRCWSFIQSFGRCHLNTFDWE